MGLAAAAFDRLDLDNRERVLVAVSGGGDSVALLVLLGEWLGARAGSTRIHAVTVDHGLRAEAAGEAEEVARLCASLGVAHSTLRWDGPKPATGLMAAAREARHRLLAAAAREAGMDIVLTGHTLDDQAETVAMRAARGDGAGLAGMAPATLFDEVVWFVRPLLGTRRSALRDFLVGRGIAWIDDPSNENPAFERVRVRAALGDAEVEALAAQAGEAGQLRAALAAKAGTLLGRFVTRPAPGLFRFDPRMFGPEAASAPLSSIGTARPPAPPPLTPPHNAEGDSEASATPSALWGGVRGGGESWEFPDAILLALRAVLATAGGMPHLPDLLRARALFERLKEGAPLRATLSRAVVDRRAGAIWIRREARDLPSLAPGVEPVLWDGRWRITAGAGIGNLSVRALGPAAAKTLASDAAEAPESLVRTALSVEPAIYDGDAFVGMAGGSEAAALGVSAVRVVAPHARYLPSFDLDVAAALRRLLALPPLPPVPWKDHIATGP